MRYATVGKDGKFTGTVYHGMNEYIQSWHDENGFSWIVINESLVNIGTEDEPDYGSPTAAQIEAQQQSNFRADRNKALAKADVEIYKLEDAGADATAWRQYRQALRDATIDWVMPAQPQKEEN